jgi:transcriptional regulator with XRE-family HTH domain
LCHAVKEERQKQNLTQAELAKKAHITQQQLSRFEVGQNNQPSLSTVSKLLHALNLEIKFISRTETSTI